MQPWNPALTLSDSVVCLEPMNHKHCQPLVAAASDGQLWDLWVTSVPRPDECAQYIESAQSARERGEQLPFVVVNSADRTVLGTTRFCNADHTNRRIEIGYTWYRQSVQRTAVNTHCKFLMLQHAFEAFGCIAVEFRTHRLNRRSRGAIERLGASLDGILRQHQIMPDGSIRDTAVYSITDAEWPGIKQHLLSAMNRYYD